MLFLLDIVVVYCIDCGLKDCPWTLAGHKAVEELVKCHWIRTGDDCREHHEAGVDVIIRKGPFEFKTAQSQGY